MDPKAIRPPGGGGNTCFKRKKNLTKGKTGVLASGVCKYSVNHEVFFGAGSGSQGQGAIELFGGRYQGKWSGDLFSVVVKTGGLSAVSYTSKPKRNTLATPQPTSVSGVCSS